MINIVLRGGIANTMFQYAFSYAQAKRFNTNIIFDVTNYKTDRLREYSLELFSGIRGKYDKVTGSLVDLHERGLPYDPELISQITKDSCIRGYFQTAKYFEPYGDDLFKIFSPSQHLTAVGRDTLREILEAKDKSVFLTIRRTDYVGNNFHGEMPMSYYEEALRIISDRTGGDLRVFIFSDDIEWCQDNIRLPYMVSWAGNWNRTIKGHIGREDEELYLKRFCAHGIMANSSYSWWAAYMGDKNPQIDQTNRIVVCPSAEHWFGPESTENAIDIPQERWIKI